MRGSGYTISNPETIAYVDTHYPHAEVDDHGNWFAGKIDSLGPVVPQVEEGEIAFIFTCDKAYFAGLMPALLSVKKHHPNVPVIVIDRGLSSIQADYLRRFASVLPSSYTIKDQPLWGKFDLSLTRFERLVYLDSDVILIDAVPGLLNSKAEFAAVRNLDWTIKENFTAPEVLQRYEVNPKAPAFNAGVFSIDNRTWGNGRLLREATKIYEEIGDHFVYGDQSALQILFNRPFHEVTFIPDEYNAIAECWNWNDNQAKPRIIHYAGDSIKPWNSLCNQPGLEYFFSYSKIVDDRDPDS